MLSRRVASAAMALFCAGLIVTPPMADPRPSRAEEPPVAKAKRKAPRDRGVSLSGRITDENGAPVADARLEMYPKDGGPVFNANSKPDGSYVMERVPSAAVYHLRIFSTRCVSLSDHRDDSLNIPLDPAKPVTRDFVLKLACRLKLTVVDEQGRPIPKVTIYRPGRYDGQYLQTDKEGQITVGGVAPTSLVSRFALQHENFAIEFLDVKLDDPKAVAERIVTLTDGKSVRGTVTCSDGKPAAGCSILALPSWWGEFMSFPNGQQIQADGAFVLPHVGPGAYKISVWVPQGNGMSTSMVLMSDVDLFNRNGPLALKTDFPSLASMGFIKGRIRYVGGRPKRGFWIHSNAQFGAGCYVQAGETTFKIGPLSAGRYRLSFESQEIEPKEAREVATGTNDLVVELKVRGPLALKGRITGGESEHALKHLRIRLVKTQWLRGPNYTPDRNWQNVADPQGSFTVEVAGPGVYVVEASADGYALGRSEPASTDADFHKELRIKLSKGIGVSGTVVDEAGRPINGATVLALSRAGAPLPVAAAKLSPGVGVATIDGRFQFDDLGPGKETFRALHPDYAFAEVKDLEIKGNGPQLPLMIVMKRGGTVRGRVFDALGRPASGVQLHFRDHNGYGSFESRESGEFASGVSDEAGEYEVKHLPESLVYISRGDEWTSLGVVRQTVLPAANKSLTVDLGGIKKVTGRLLVNGSPLANKKVLLSGEDANFDIMKAFAMTDAEGNFVFRGIPPGERYLFYLAGTERLERWVRVKPLLIETSNDAFGTIELATATLTVRVPGADPDAPGPIYVSVSRYDPIWFALGAPANSAPRKDKNDPFVFRDLPVGKYALAITRSGKLSVRQVIEIKAAGEKLVTVDFPKGSAAIRGTFKQATSDSRGYLQLRSKDNRLLGQLEVKPDGKFEFGGLPAGEYFITQQSVVNADALATFSLAEGETKSISLSGKLAAPRRLPTGFLQVKPYAVDGLPLPGCQITLTGAKGEIARHSSQFGQVSFKPEPGPYRLSVTYPGFAQVIRQVEVQPVLGGRWGQDHELNVTLVRLTEQTKSESR